ncbi:MAG: peptidoglycan-binding protein [Acidobacteriota bacterium]|nr:MAG: peptidoglycan-binding protein [Acidobacteriota bacterium]
MKLILIATILFSSLTVRAQEGTSWRITEKEVTAVQVELYKRGLYREKLTGVLDRRTREAVRAWQQKSGLPVNGRIDRQTYESLDLRYPATGREAEELRRTGLLPKIGYGVRDATVATGETLGGAAGKVKEGTQTGLEKTWDLGASTVDKSKEAAGGLGQASARGARGLGRGAQRVSTSLIGRSDAEVSAEVRELLDQNPETEKWVTSVKDGMVTVKVPPGHRVDLGQVISDIRKIAGVKSVFVVNL